MDNVVVILAEDSPALVEIHWVRQLHAGKLCVSLAFIFLVSWANAQPLQTVTDWY